MKGNFMSLIFFGKINLWPFACASHLYNLKFFLFSSEPKEFSKHHLRSTLRSLPSTAQDVSCPWT